MKNHEEIYNENKKKNIYKEKIFSDKKYEKHLKNKKEKLKHFWENFNSKFQSQRKTKFHS